MDTTYKTTEDPAPKKTAKETVDNETQKLKTEAERAKHEAKQKASKAYEDAKVGARKALQDSKTYAKDVVSNQKNALVNKLDEYKSAIVAASDKLEAENDDIAASKIRKAANGIDNVTGYLRDTEPADLYDEASRLAKKHPELVFGGLFIAGLGLARFLKSSASERRSEAYYSQTTDRTAASELEYYTPTEAVVVNEPVKTNATTNPTALP